VPVRRALAIALVLAAAMPVAWAQKADDEEEDAEEEEGEEEEEEAAAPASGKDAVEEEEEEDDAGLRPKQNLTGHDLGTKKRENEFERDRFFVDKVDTDKTEDGTLIQGSIASSTFLYKEMGGAFGAPMNGDLDAGNNNGPSRLFTELRLQTDFRHIKASRWEARVDARARVLPPPRNAVQLTPTPENNIQSGFNGENEFELRELWLVRSGKRSDFFIGRQFVPDLGGVKFDGIRVDYAKSGKLTFIGFGGLYPVRGSRSVTTDYLPLKTESGADAGRLVGTGGFGAAYRTVNAYGAIGGVAMYPLKIESPRFYITSTGYLRSGSKLDVYHFALVDLLGSAAADSTAHVQLTNLSIGANAKPNPRLRLTASFNRVDTDTLNVQAGAFLGGYDPSMVGQSIVQNEAYIIRLATNQARAGVSAGLGKAQRFEISTAVSYRYRQQFDLLAPETRMKLATLPAAKSIEVWGGIVDRRSIKGTRIGIDGSQTFSVGDVAYQRSELFMGRLFVNREIRGGRGEWEAEGSYSKVKDSTIGGNINCVANVADCYGASNNTVIAVGGQMFYRLKTDWFGIGTLHVMRISNKRSDQVVDPAVLGITGFVRIAKRF
jgi:hypothetical protein